MRIHFGTKIGGARIGTSVSTKGAGKALLNICLFPFYLLYYMCVWPFVALYRVITKKTKKDKAEAAMMAPQYLRIINDCSRLVGETKNPEVFFKRYDLLLETLSKLADIETVAPIKGEKPSVELQRISALREVATNDFIERYAQDTRMNIYKLSSEKAKIIGTFAPFSIA